jgi:2-dehydro-3-deoxy-D-arabinonate dehydratase
MKLCRFIDRENEPRVGLLADATHLLDLRAAGVATLCDVLEAGDPLSVLTRFSNEPLPRLSLSEVTLVAPADHQEIWAAGVTYLRSKRARMEESDFSANAYDRVYEADRPELFFKCMPGKVVGPNQPVGIRKDAHWNVPEPELVLVLNSGGTVAGYTIGNDMSSRDIEGENTLYLPQAKVYSRSCAVGPWIVVGPAEAEARTWKIELKIRREGHLVFQGETQVSQIKRTFSGLAGYLFKSQHFPHGTMLLTGTGIVPPDGFTLEEGDRVRIGISGIGVLENPVVRV